MAGDIRVLLVDLSKRYGGASVRALTLARHFPNGGAAIVGLKDSPVIQIARARGIPFETAGRSRLDPLIPLHLRRIIRRGHYTLIDTQNIQSKCWGSLTALITDVAFTATLNSSYKNEQGGTWKGGFYSLLDRLTNAPTDRFIAVSEAIRQELVHAGVPEGMIDLVANAVETDMKDAPVDPQEFRAGMGLPPKAFLCASVGRLVWAKGHEDLIAAFKKVAGQLPNAHALIVGDGALYSALSAQIHQAGLAERVHLLGFCQAEKVRRLLLASDVFVLPSRSEGMPFALLEAAALGLPIVSTRCGGIAEVLEDSVEALLVPVGDSDALAEGILRLSHDRPLAQSLGRAAKRKIQRDFGIEQQMEALVEAYQKACEHKWNKVQPGASASFRRKVQP